MTRRAIWKGMLRISELSCPVALYAAASSSERVSFHTINRKTGNRVRRQFVDSETGDAVEREDQVKGYDTGGDSFVLLTPEEIAEAVPESDKTLSVESFIACGGIDTVYFDKPYFLRPADDAAEEAFVLIREGMRKKNVAALARAVLFRHVRTVLIRAQGRGFVANTLNFDYEVRSAEDAFSDIPDIKTKGEMLKLAKHIIGTKKGEFDPSQFDDRYDEALRELVKLKMEGHKIEAPKRKRSGKVIDLMEALRKSAEQDGKSKKARSGGRKAKTGSAQRRKAG
jgi:DNA end-binding protein Ku